MTCHVGQDNMLRQGRTSSFIIREKFSMVKQIYWQEIWLSNHISTQLGRVRLGSIRIKNNWNNASKRLFGSYSHSGIPGFHSGYSAPRSRIAGIYSGIHSYSGIFPNERALRLRQCNWICKDLNISTAEKDMKTWQIIAVTYTTA